MGSGRDLSCAISNMYRPCEVEIYQMDLRLQRHVGKFHIIEDDSYMVSNNEPLQVVHVGG